jgi:adenosine deaminase
MKLKALLAYLLFLILGSLAIVLFPKSQVPTPEEKTAQSFDQARTNGPQLLAFLRQMPKGGDLHSHLSGAVYAESFVRWATERELCVDEKTLKLSKPFGESGAETQCPGGVRLKQDLAANDQALYARMIDSWSMRNWELSGKSGHDQFFDSFGKFSALTDRVGEMVAEAMVRAEDDGVTYLELMLSLDGDQAPKVGSDIKWNSDYEATVIPKILEHKLYKPTVQVGLQSVYDADRIARAVLRCNESEANPGCKVNVRYICQVSRGRELRVVLTQMLMAFEMAETDAKRANPSLVGVNLVQPEDGLVAMNDFSLHMQMLRTLKLRYPHVKVTLHAGELAPGMVPPEGLRSHVKESVEIGGARRIGHGADILYEKDYQSLLREMAEKSVLVEICLTSNDKILGLRGRDHPLGEYLKFGVPVALATDDQGVARSDLTTEYKKAVEEQGLDYQKLKNIARNSLEYAFVSGRSLWLNSATYLEMIAACNPNELEQTTLSQPCEDFLAQNERARLQWSLEKAFKTFERNQG